MYNLDYARRRESEIIEELEEVRYKENTDYFQMVTNKELLHSATVRDQFRRLLDK